MIKKTDDTWVRQVANGFDFASETFNVFGVLAVFLAEDLDGVFLASCLVLGQIDLTAGASPKSLVELKLV